MTRRCAMRVHLALDLAFFLRLGSGSGSSSSSSLLGSGEPESLSASSESVSEPSIVMPLSSEAEAARAW